MTAPDATPDRPSPAIPAAAPVTTGTPGPDVRPAAVPTALQAATVPARDGKAGPVDTSKPWATADATKPTGPSTAPTGGGNSLRQAVQELTASVACLLGHEGRRDESGARRHLAEAARILSAPSREAAQRGAIAPRASLPAPASQDGDGTGDIQQDLQRAMR